jgi:S-methylmethionine-dependent homocysteine/selenocysteine methylase
MGIPSAKARANRVSSHPILSRLDTGRPLLVSGDPVASLRALGRELPGQAPLGRLLREHPSAIREHYYQDITTGIDVLCCITADTMPRALQQIGMPFRAAALTGQAVDLALDAAEMTPRPLIVAGVLGNTDVPPVPVERLSEELGTHARRLATDGCELILARGFAAGGGGAGAGGAGGTEDGDGAAYARLARRTAITSGVLTELPTWGVVGLDWSGFTRDGEAADECARHAFDAGAGVALFEIPSAEVGLGWIDRLFAVCAASRRGPDVASGNRYIGFSIAAGALDPDGWAHEARRLLEADVRVLGGGPGTTQRHLAALSSLVRSRDRQSLWPRAV